MRKLRLLWSIFSLYHVLHAVIPYAARLQSNSLTSPSHAVPKMYTVQRGDSLSRVAVKFRIPLRRLAQGNQIAETAFLAIGQRLVIPDAASVTESKTAMPTAPAVTQARANRPDDEAAKAKAHTLFAILYVVAVIFLARKLPAPTPETPTYQNTDLARSSRRNIEALEKLGLPDAVDRPFLG